jgi:FAD:protein FMN transferase
MDYKFLQNRKNNFLKRGVTKTVKILLLFAALFYFNAYAQSDEIKFEMSANKYLMGTLFEITAVHTNIDSGKKAMYYALREVERIENMMSNYKDSSEISYVNKNAFLKPVKVSTELFGIIERSIAYSNKFEGYFDITVGPLTNYWGFNSDHPIKTEPDKNKIKELLEFVNYQYIKIDYTDSTVSFLKNGVEIDLGGIAKGYALDMAVEILRNRGVNDFLISGGGDIYASGRKADGKKWVIGIKDPRNNENLAASMEVENTGVCTSGDYERFEIINGKRYHHIFNPKTGFPAPGSQSSTVVTGNCEEGVVLSKLLFIRGENYRNFLNGIPYYEISGDSYIMLNVAMEKMIKEAKK